VSTLIVEELQTTLEQTITFNNWGRFQLEGMALYLYMHNAPAGTFTVSVKDGATTLVSKDFTSAEIKTDLSTSDNYAYLWKPIELDNTSPLRTQNYTVEISSSGYTYSSGSYLGWIKPYENVYNDIEEVNYDTLNSFGVYFYTKQNAGER